MTPGQTVRLTFAGRVLWPDLGTRTATVEQIDGAHVVLRWPHIVWTTRILAEMVAVLLLVLAISPAHAEPSANADPALAPFYRSLQQPGTGALCCDRADCRPVVTRWHGGKLWAFIGSQFPDNPEPNWREVPQNVIIHGVPNQAGEPIACWYNREVRCFIDSGNS